LGYGNNGTGDATSINKHNCTYLLKTVTVGSAAGLSNLQMDIIHDDGVIVYINGTEAIRSALVPPGPIDYMTELLGFKDPEDERVSYQVDPTLFVDGDNVIAVELRNQRESSSDIQFCMAFNGDYAPPSTPPATVVAWKSYKVAASSDDAEEHIDANDNYLGYMESLTSSDLELGMESGTNAQIVGVRFTGLEIPQGATIDSAYIQFTCDDDNDEPISVVIAAEDADNSETFSQTDFNISLRDQTDAQVLWSNIPAWLIIDERGPDQRTPDLAALVQEVVDRPGYALGNPISFFLTAYTGEREAESWDDHGESNTTGHPELFVKFPVETAVEEKGNVVRTFNLSQNYPNPFNPSTTIDFDIAKAGHVTLSVYNVLGQEVATLIDQDMGIGHHTAQWNTDATVTAGIYFYKINTNDNVQIRKMTLLK